MLDQEALAIVSRLLINLFDGLLLAWSAHGDQERLNAETEAACQAVEAVGGQLLIFSKAHL